MQHGQGAKRQWALMAFNNSEQSQTVTLDLPADAPESDDADSLKGGVHLSPPPSAWCRLQADAAADGRGDDAEFRHQAIELRREGPAELDFHLGCEGESVGGENPNFPDLIADLGDAGSRRWGTTMETRLVRENHHQGTKPRSGYRMVANAIDPLGVLVPWW